MKQPSYPYTAMDQLLILNWANYAGFRLRLQEGQFFLTRVGHTEATIHSNELFDRLVAEVAQIAAKRINFHLGEHAFITLKKLQPKTLSSLLDRTD